MVYVWYSNYISMKLLLKKVILVNNGRVCPFYINMHVSEETKKFFTKVVTDWDFLNSAKFLQVQPSGANRTFDINSEQSKYLLESVCFMHLGGKALKLKLCREY